MAFRSFLDSLINKDDKVDQLHAAVTALPDSLKQPTSEVALQPPAAKPMFVEPLPALETPEQALKGVTMETPATTGTDLGKDKVLMTEAEVEAMIAPKPPMEAPTKTTAEDEDEARAREYADAMGEASVMVPEAPKIDEKKIEEAITIPDEPTIETVSAPTTPAEAVTAEDAGAKAKEANDKIIDALEAFDKGEISEAELQALQTELEATIREWAEKANRLEAESNEAAEALKVAALKLDEKASELAEHIVLGPATALDDEAEKIELNDAATPDEKKRGGFLSAIARWYERGTRGGRRDRVNNKFAPVLAYAGREMDESADRGKKALRSAGLSVGSVAAAVVAPFALLGMGGLLAGDALVRGVGTLRTTATGAAAGVTGGIGVAGTVLGGATREALGRGLAAGIRAAGNVEEVQDIMREQNAAATDARISALEAQIARQNDQMAEMLALLKKQNTPGTESNA